MPICAMGLLWGRVVQDGEGGRTHARSNTGAPRLGHPLGTLPCTATRRHALGHRRNARRKRIPAKRRRSCPETAPGKRARGAPAKAAVGLRPCYPPTPTVPKRASAAMSRARAAAAVCAAA